MTVKISSAARMTMLAQAAADTANEVCGLMFGDVGRIDFVQPTRNVAPDTGTHFEIDATALIAALRAERNGGPRLAGYYHSHPNGLSKPSATDRAMASPDGRIWVIIANGGLTAWRATANGLVSLPIAEVNLPFTEQSAKGARAKQDTQ